MREGSRDWWVFLVTGIAWLVIAWLVLRVNVTSITTVGVLLGVAFIAAGVNEAGLGSLVSGGWNVWHNVMSFIFLLGGLWALIRPVNTFFALASWFQISCRPSFLRLRAYEVIRDLLNNSRIAS